MPVNKHLTLVTFCLLSIASTQLVFPVTAVPTERSRSVGLGKSPSTSNSNPNNLSQSPEFFKEVNDIADRVITKPNTNTRYTGIVKRVDDIAQQITVRIEDINGGNGSGVIVAKQGDTYYVATAAHVVQDIKKVNGRKVPKEKIAKVIVTPSQERITINPSDINVANVDLDVAVVKFQSRQKYRVADVNRSSFNKADWVFLSGFPGVDRHKQRRLSIGIIQDRSNAEFAVKSRDREFGSLSNGNGLVYSNLSLPGMSGGAVLDRQGRVVGINTGAENEIAGGAEINFGYALGIPIATMLGVGEIPTTSGQVTDTPLAKPTQSESVEIRQKLATLPKPSATATAAAWLDYGNLLWRSSKDRESVDAFKIAIKLLEREPDSGDRQNKLRIAYFGMGVALLNNSNNSAAAVAAFERAVKYVPQDYQSWRYLGLSLRGLKRYDEAVAAHRQAINYQKQDFVLYTGLGDALGELKRYPEAMNAYNAALMLQPNHPWAYNARGGIYSLQNQYDRALADFNQAIKLDPQDTAAYSNRGLIYALQNQNGRALTDFNQAVKLDPQYKRVYMNRGRMYISQNQNDRALADFNQAVKLDPQDTVAYVARGHIYSLQNQNDRALADLNQAIKLDPQLVGAYILRGGIYDEQNQNDRALADFNQAIKLDPQLVEAYILRGNIYSQQKQYDLALADLEKAAQIYLAKNNSQGYQKVMGYIQKVKDFKR